MSHLHQRVNLTNEQVATRATYRAECRAEFRRYWLRMTVKMALLALLILIAWADVILALCLGGPR